MIPFDDARKIVLDHAGSTGWERIAFQDAPGRILYEDVFSDTDMPPFDKAAVDGFAVLSTDVSPSVPGDTDSPATLRVIETIPAGSVPVLRIEPGTCARIMTGSMVPGGADAVVMVEHTGEVAPGQIIISQQHKARNICYKGEDIRKGEAILRKGTRIGIPETAVLAATGNTMIKVSKMPCVSVISTGNELVEPHHLPGPAQIRNSNASQLMLQLQSIPVLTHYAGIATDTPADLKEMIDAGLAHDVVILTGGVSMGDFDLVPAVMQELGITIHFRSVAIQPGKPTVFGTRGTKYIFGLPGNPVSSFVLTELMVKPFLLRLMGHNAPDRFLTMAMGSDYRKKASPRNTVVPVIFRDGKVFPVEYHGSAHIHAYTGAHGMLLMDPGCKGYEKNQMVDVRPI